MRNVSVSGMPPAGGEYGMREMGGGGGGGADKTFSKIDICYLFLGKSAWASSVKDTITDTE